MRTYLYLFLFAPVVNKYLDGITLRDRVCLLLVLGFMGVYVGILGWDASLLEGKNLVYFILIYVIGNTLHRYEHAWRRIPVGYLIAAYLLLNLALVSCSCFFCDTIIAKAIWRLFFPYQSPGLIINGILFFMIILHWQFKSKRVNWLASSALAIYLIHETGLVEYYLLGPISREIRGYMGNDLLTLPAVALFAMVVCIVFILIDKGLSPLWRWFARMGEALEVRTNNFWLTLSKRQ